MKKLKLRLTYAALKASKVFNFKGLDAVAFIWLLLVVMLIGLGFCDAVSEFIQRDTNSGIFFSIGLVTFADAAICYVIIWMAYLIEHFYQSADWSEGKLIEAISDLRMPAK